MSQRTKSDGHCAIACTKWQFKCGNFLNKENLHFKVISSTHITFLLCSRQVERKKNSAIDFFSFFREKKPEKYFKARIKCVRKSIDDAYGKKMITIRIQIKSKFFFTLSLSLSCCVVIGVGWDVFGLNGITQCEHFDFSRGHHMLVSLLLSLSFAKNKKLFGHRSINHLFNYSRRERKKQFVCATVESNVFQHVIELLSCSSCTVRPQAAI